MVVLPLPMSLPYTPSLNPRNGDRIAQSVRNGDRIAQSVRRGDDPRATLLSWPPRSLTDPPSAHRVSCLIFLQEGRRPTSSLLIVD